MYKPVLGCLLLLLACKSRKQQIADDITNTKKVYQAVTEQQKNIKEGLTFAVTNRLPQTEIEKWGADLEKCKKAGDSLQKRLAVLNKQLAER